MITPGNVDDKKPLHMERYIKKLWGKLYGDKGYIAKELFQSHFANGIHLVTKLRKNMRSAAITPIMDAILLRKRTIVETIIDQLKNIFQIAHTQVTEAQKISSLICSAPIAYNFTEKKPSLRNNFVDTKQPYLAL